MEWWSNGVMGLPGWRSGSGNVENGRLEWCRRRVGEKNPRAQLHVFTRNYTLLHNVPGGNVNVGNGVLESWSNGQRWEKAVECGRTNPPFPTLAGLSRVFLPAFSHVFPP